MTLRVGATIDPARLHGRRWFAEPARPGMTIVLEERFEVAGGGALGLMRVEGPRRRPVRYTLPIDDAADDPLAESSRGPWAGLATLAATGGVVRGEAGMTLAGVPPPGASRPAHGAMASAAMTPAAVVRPLGIDQSHSSVVIDEARVVKVYRRLAPGPNPELELAVALARPSATADAAGARPGAPVPRFEGALRVAAGSGTGTMRSTWDVAVVQAYVAGAADEFERLADGLAAWLRNGAPPEERAPLVVDAAAAGRATAALHAALAALRGPAFGRRPATPAVRTAWARRADRALSTALRVLPAVDRDLAAELRGHRPAIERALAPLQDPAIPVELSRIHGDLHLGQLIRAGDRFLVADLEGEPTRTAAERRRRDTPARDVASMLRAYDHVARSALRRAGADAPAGAGTAIDRWIDLVRADFRTSYLATAAELGLAVRLEPTLLHALEVEKELYEFAYAVAYLPAWRYAPAAGLRWLLDRGQDRD